MGWEITAGGYGQIGPYGVFVGAGTNGITGYGYIDGNAIITAGAGYGGTLTWDGELVQTTEWYTGLSLPPGSPIAASVQHGMTTDSNLVTLGVGLSGIAEIGVSVEIVYVSEPYTGLAGTGIGVQSPGSARVLGYQGRDGTGILLAGDELNALDAMAEYNYRNGYSVIAPTATNSLSAATSIAANYIAAVDAAAINTTASVSYTGGNDRNKSVTVTDAPVPVTNTVTGVPQDITTTTETYGNGSVVVTKTDPTGNGTATTTTATGATVTYTLTNGGADIPVVLDLDGDGIEISFAYSASFDYDGDGFRERTAWVAPDDAFLVIDLNADGTRGAGDGLIDQRKELVLSAWATAGSTDLQTIEENNEGLLLAA